MDHENEIATFISIAKCSRNQATQALEENNWDLNEALNHFDYSGTNSSSSSNRKNESFGQSHFATLDSFRHNEMEEDDNEKEKYFAGGDKSGILMEGDGNPKDQTSELLKKILTQAAKGRNTEIDEKPVEKEKQRFTGKGYRLGSEEDQDTNINEDTSSDFSSSQKPEKVKRMITFWKNGFSLDDGPLLDYKSHQNVLKNLEEGYAPTELFNVKRGEELSVEVSHKLNENYVPPPKKLKPFEGVGQKLGSYLPGSMEVSGSSSSVNNNANTSSRPSQEITIDKNAPTTTLQIRFSDGSRKKATFNHTHTIADVKQYIDSINNTSRPYILKTSFPNKEYRDESMTLKDANLLNAVVIQHHL